MNPERIDFITECAKSACKLEAKSPKPGNVTPQRDFSDTTYGDFTAGAMALKPTMAEAATRGSKVGNGTMPARRIGIGSLIKEAVERVRNSHKGGNTHLGISMLFVPLAAAAGVCVGKGHEFGKLKDNVTVLLDRSTVDDSIGLYDAINISKAGGMGDSELDVNDDESKERIKKEFIKFIDIMRISADRDRVAHEIANYYPITIDIGAHLFANFCERIKSREDAVVQLYLTLLSRFPDTLITRKAGAKMADKVSKLAGEVLEAGGVLTKEGKIRIEKFDDFLRSDGNSLNPGTTADLVASSIFVYMLRNP